MSLRTKIGLSFFISASMIAILSTFEFIHFIQIKNEIRYLEVTDTIRSQSLQIRRHEKNFFLYPLKEKEESEAIQEYIDQLNSILAENSKLEKSGELTKMQGLISNYGKRLTRIKELLDTVRVQFRQVQASHAKYSSFYPLMEMGLNDQPLRVAELLQNVFELPQTHSLVTMLVELDAEIDLLRKTGEDLISASRDLDKVARHEVDSLIQISQAAIILFMISFFISGITTLYLINRNVVSRLKLLIGIIEGTGKGHFSQVDVPLGKWDNDEVGMLITEFNNMEKELLKREEELNRKNLELLQSKKLAAIGTLAAGVAHELNNPLNNIYLSVQVLRKMAGENCPAVISEIVEDITSQSTRVKHIVGELLEFARGREPNLEKIEIESLLSRAYRSLSGMLNTDSVLFSITSSQDSISIEADTAQMEQLFINLFHNAVEAMSGNGYLKVDIESHETEVEIRVSDTGPGIPPDSLERIFEPFFTRKDKGTGLGLAIVFNIVLKHSGDIRVESEEGKGTTFIITLPKGKNNDGA